MRSDKAPAFSSYRFKRDLQEICGYEHDDHRAVEAVGDACERMMEEGVDVLTAGWALMLAAKQIVRSHESLAEYWNFCRYLEETGQGGQRSVEQVCAELGLTSPKRE